MMDDLKQQQQALIGGLLQTRKQVASLQRDLAIQTESEAAILAQLAEVHNQILATENQQLKQAAADAEAVRKAEKAAREAASAEG